MADLTGFGFSPETTESMGDGFTVLPPGVYTVVIVASELADTKARDGSKMLVLRNQIIEGRYTGETVDDRLNLLNVKNEKTAKIARSQLKDICEAIGHRGQLLNSEALHGKPYSIQIINEPFKSEDGKELLSNKIKKRMPRQAPKIFEGQDSSPAPDGASGEQVPGSSAGGQAAPGPSQQPMRW